MTSRRWRYGPLDWLEQRITPTSIVVTNLGDAGPGSLRDAIEQANMDSVQDTITFAPDVTGAIDLLTPLPDLSTSLSINGPGASVLTVERSSDPETPAFRIFTVTGNVVATISDLTIAGGSVVGTNGGGVSNAGALTIAGCVFTGNSVAGVPSLGANGGAIYNVGQMNMAQSIVRGNSIAGGLTGGGWGAGIYNAGSMTIADDQILGNSIGGGAFGAGRGAGLYNSGTLSITRTQILSNTIGGGSLGTGSGGGLFNDTSATLYLDASTVANNIIEGNFMTGGSGAGVFNSGRMSVLNCTVTQNVAQSTAGGSGPTSEGRGGGIFNDTTGNTALVFCTISTNTVGDGVYQLSHGFIRIPGAGGGLYNAGAVTLTDTIVAGNGRVGGAGATDIQGAVDSASAHNLVGTGTGLSGITNGTNGNLVGDLANPIDPRLGPLGENGGPTLTQALLGGSPALDAGVAVPGVTTDQRGYPRTPPNVPDIGAFEVQPVYPAPTVTGLERYGVHRQPTRLVVRFSAAMDVSRAEALSNYQLTTTMRNRKRGAWETVVVPIRTVIYASASPSVTIAPSVRLPLRKTYRLTVVGTPPSGLTSSLGVFLDGASTGAPGTNYVVTFGRNVLQGPSRGLSTR